MEQKPLPPGKTPGYRNLPQWSDEWVEDFIRLWNNPRLTTEQIGRIKGLEVEGVRSLKSRLRKRGFDLPRKPLLPQIRGKPPKGVKPKNLAALPNHEKKLRRSGPSAFAPPPAEKAPCPPAPSLSIPLVGCKAPIARSTRTGVAILCCHGTAPGQDFCPEHQRKVF